MAVDEWLLTQVMGDGGGSLAGVGESHGGVGRLEGVVGVSGERCPLWLRLYTWRPGAITFGRNQREDATLDWKQVGGTPVIRRVTGGRALYHDKSELTYAVAADLGALEGTVLGGSIAQTGQVISEALVMFLQARGLESQYMRHSSSDNARPDFFHKAPCFASHARHEIKSAAGKVVASAQRRVGRALLQHGAIKIGGVVRHPALGMIGECEECASQSVTEEILEVDSARLVRAFERVLGIDFECRPLGRDEAKQVRGRRDLVRKKRLVLREVLNSCGT